MPAHKLNAYQQDSTKRINYYDDIYVGYRYFDTYGAQPLFAFGHGLSYTTFSYSNLTLTTTGKKVIASFIITNTGKKGGAEVAQVYVHQNKSALPRPEKELKGFQKIYLQAGEAKKMSITLEGSAFQYFNDVTNNWVSEPGSFEVRVGGSSMDIRLKGEVKIR